MAVIIKQREPSGGKIKLYLQYSPPVRSTRTGNAVEEEDLPTYIYERAKDLSQERFNAGSMRRANEIKECRELAIKRGDIRLYSAEVGLMEFYRIYSTTKKNKYMCSLNILRQYAGADIPFNKVTVSFCEAYREYLQGCPVGQNGKPIKISTCHNYFSHFINVLYKAYESELISFNPVDRLEQIPLEVPDARRLTNNDLRLLLSTRCENDFVYRICCISLLTGLRYNEITSLKWEQIITDGERPYIRRILQNSHREEHLFISQELIRYFGKKQKRYGPIFCDLPCRGSMQDYLAEWARKAGIRHRVTYEEFRRNLYTLKPFISKK